MASPQIEDGYTRFANELIEAFAGIRLAGQEAQVVWAVARLTYGYLKKNDKISHGQISSITNIPRPKIAGLMKSLISKKVLTATNNGSKRPLTIGINKHYNEWVHLLPKKGIPNNGSRTATNNGSKTATNNGTYQRKKKERNKDSVILPEWINLEVWKDFGIHRAAKKAPLTPGAIKKTIEDLTKLRESGDDPNEVLKQSMGRGWTGVFPIKDKDKTIPPKLSGSALLDYMSEHPEEYEIENAT